MSTSVSVPTDLVLPGRAALLLAEPLAPVTVFVGPPGLGKTSIARAWVDDLPHRSTWTSLRSGPGAAAAQLASVIETVEDQVSGAATGDEVLVVVLDDVHRADGQLLEQLLHSSGDPRSAVRLVLIGRSGDALRAARALGLRPTVLDARSLRLEVADIRELAAALGRSVDRHAASRLRAAVGGWPVLVRRVLEEMQTQELPLAAAGLLLEQDIWPEVVGEALLVPLMRLALAERPTRRLAHHLMPGDTAERLLAALGALGFVELRYDATDVHFSVPEVLGDSLRCMLGREHPELVESTHRAMAGWYREHPAPGGRGQALRHATAGRDWKLADEIWSRHNAELSQTHPQDVLRLARALPREVLVGRPDLALYSELAAVVAVADPTSAAGAILHAYARQPRIATDPASLAAMTTQELAVTGVGQMIGRRIKGQFAAARRLGESLGSVLAARAGELHPALGDRGGWCEVQRGLTETLMGQHRPAVELYEAGWRFRATSSPHISANAAANLALSWSWLGRPDAAERWIAALREIDVSEMWGGAIVSIGGHLAAAQLAQDRLDIASSAEHLRAALPSLGGAELWPYIAYLESTHALLLEDPAGALNQLDSVVHTRTAQATGPAARRLLARARIDLHVANRQLIRAQRVLESHAREESDPLIAVGAARLRLQRGDFTVVRGLAARIAWEPTTSERERCELLFLATVAALRQGELDMARELATAAMAVQRRTHLLRPFLDMLPDERLEVIALSGQSLSRDDSARLGALAVSARPSTSLPILTPRERLLAARLLANSTRREIAASFVLSENTIRNQIATLYRKLGVNTRAAAVRRLQELGFPTSSDWP